MFKDIAVHLTGSSGDSGRIAAAVALATQFDAHLSGLYVHQMPELLAITDPTGSAYLQQLLAAAADVAVSTGAGLQQALAATGLRQDLRRLDTYPGLAGAALADEARLSDIIVCTRPYGDPAGEHAIEEAVLFRSGRPCLFIPPRQPDPPAQFSRIYLGWKNTPEATRALGDAMPLMSRATSVIVGVAREVSRSGHASVEGAAVGRYLSRHGIHAEVHEIDGGLDVGAALLDDAWKSEADLIVIGAYGHSRFREWLLGGVTRHVLSEATVPVLASH